MLTKIGVTALLGALSTAAVGGTAAANEPCRTPVAVRVAAPIATPVYYHTPGVYYRHDRRAELARLQRQRHEEALRHAAWLRQHHGLGRR